MVPSGLWSIASYDVFNWVFIALAGAPGTICCGRWLFDRGKMRKSISGDFRLRSFSGADDSMLQIQVSLFAATRVLYDELLKIGVVSHEHTDVAQSVFLEFKLIFMLPLRIFTIVRMFVYPLSRDCSGTSQDKGILYVGPLQVKEKMSMKFLKYNQIGNYTLDNARRCLPGCSQLLGFLFRNKVRYRGV